MIRHLSDFRPFLNEVLRLVVKDYSFTSDPPLWRVLQENPRLVIAISHSTPSSWLPVSCVMTEEACKAGGGSRKPLGVMHKFFFQYPILRKVAHFISQSSHGLGFTDLIRRFQKLDRADLVIFPEGSNALFGDPETIKPFRSPRFVEIAIRSGTPILMVVHRGSESWAKTIPLPSMITGLLGRIPTDLASRAAAGGALAIPILPTRKIPLLQVSCELYHPSLKPEDLDQDRAIRRAQVTDEAEKVRLRMSEMLEQLQSAG